MSTRPLPILHLEDALAESERVQGLLVRTGLDGTFQRVNTKEEFTRAVVEFEPDVVLADHSAERFNAFDPVCDQRGTRAAGCVLVRRIGRSFRVFP